MIRISYRVRHNATLVKKGKEHLRAQVPKIASKRLRAAAKELQVRMSKPGKPIRYPPKWDNEKQRLYVIIMLRKRGKLPYSRTGAHSKSFKVVEIKSGFSVLSSKKSSKYLYGDARGEQQSRLHQGRWPKFRDQADIVIRKLPKTVTREMVALAKRMPK